MLYFPEVSFKDHPLKSCAVEVQLALVSTTGKGKRIHSHCHLLLALE